jgi:hypothetical protein
METLVEDVQSLGEDGSGFGDFMKEIEQNMLHMMKESAKAPATALEHWQAFSAAIDWSENWIRGLLTFHVVLFSVIVYTRKNESVQSVLFIFVCALIFISEQLNTYCALNWQVFAKQNYFDNHGVFAGTLYAGPLLLIALFQLVSRRKITFSLRGTLCHFVPNLTRIL